MADIAPFGRYRALDENGAPLAGGKLYTYEAGTTTPKRTFIDQAETAENTNPVILDSEGYADVWLDVGGYKFILQDSNDVQQWSVDNIAGGVAGGFGSTVIERSSSFGLSTLEENNVIVCTASFTVSLLPAATAGNGFKAIFINTSSGNVTIDPNGAETIDGTSSLVMSPGSNATIVGDGTEWYSMVRSDILTNNTGELYTNQNFGVGTNSPSSKLEASQTATGTVITVTSTTSGSSVEIGGDASAVGFVRSDTDSDLSLGADGGSDIFIDATNSNVSIGKGSAAVSNALLELDSTSQGFLLPRMTTTQRNAISSPDTGLTIFNTTTNQQENYNGSAWVSIAPDVNEQVAQAWVNFEGTGTVSIRDSFNVSSITDNGTGNYTVNLTSAMASTDYVVQTTASWGGGLPTRPGWMGVSDSAANYTTSSFIVLSQIPSNFSPIDATYAMITVFGGN